MGIIEFARHRRAVRAGGDEFNFADESSAPSCIDAGAEILLHAGNLRLPDGAIGGKFEATSQATKRARMRGDLRADDGRPHAFEPCESGIRMIDAADYIPKKISSAVHEQRILALIRARL